jgi:hypothetical protein
MRFLDPAWDRGFDCFRDYFGVGVFGKFWVGELSGFVLMELEIFDFCERALVRLKLERFCGQDE